MRFALAGNPNSGKTTLFNTLTGSTARVGNWPGVTVDKKEGRYKKLGESIDIVDLPGIYSLSPYTPEEVISRNYIIHDKPDLVINIVDGTNLARNLYLTTQLLEMDCPIIVALNMADILEKSGTKIDVEGLGKVLGVPVIPISALRSNGMKVLMEKGLEEAKKERKGYSVLEASNIGAGYQEIRSLVEAENGSESSFTAVKLLEGDSITEQDYPGLVDKVQKVKKGINIDEMLDGDFEAAVADARYRFITDKVDPLVKETIKKEEHGFTHSDKIDKVLTNRWLGIPIFAVFMFLIFHFTFGENFLFFTGLPSPGVWLQGLTESLMGLIGSGVSGLLESVGAAAWVHGLLVDGLIAGLGAILSFLPQILMLFLFLSILEDSGYMARVAFIMDRVLRKFGLSGKAFMPLLMGFGCSVPAMMGTRTLESAKERRMTIMLMPFFSCGAKLPIWAIFAAALFPGYADWVVFGMYFLGILVAVLAAIILKKTLLKGSVAPFIMELPAYHLPRLKNVAAQLWDKLKSFLLRASTIIAAATVVIWFLANFDFTLNMVEPNSANSIIGVIGSFIQPMFVPLGFAFGPDGWKAVVAILTGLIAKEMVVSSMGVLYNPTVGGDALEDSGASTALMATIAATFSPLAAVSFMAFNLLSVPCMAAVATAHGEMRSKKWTAITIAFWITTAYVVSLLIYQVGTLIMNLF